MTLRRETKLEDILSWDKVDGVISGLVSSNVLDINNIRSNSNGGAASNRKTNYLEPLYMVTAPVAAAATSILNFQIDFERILNTFVSLNKDIYFNSKILYLKIMWNPTTKILFNTTVNTNALTNAASPGPAQVVNISNLAMYLAIEMNPQIENMIKAKCSSTEGLQILFSFVYYNKLSLG